MLLSMKYVAVLLALLFSPGLLPVVQAQQVPIQTDLNGDGKVNGRYIFFYSAHWGSNIVPQYEWNPLRRDFLLQMIQDWHKTSDRRINPYTQQEEWIIPLAALAQNAHPLTMVKIPAGTFTMGSDLPNTDIIEEWRKHPVTINRAFFIGKFEVTQAQWLAVMGDNPSTNQNNSNQPVESISWEECQEFINRLNESEQSPLRFRLPTEQEWEYACRAGTSTEYSHGSGETCTPPEVRPTDPCSEHIAFMWYAGNNSISPRSAGTKLPNPWGLYDMHGNVNEYCQDIYITPLTQVQYPNERVVRGGSFASPDWNCRSAARSAQPVNAGSITIGFRLAADVIEDS
jgi:formylglycine-generating enzyme required for sulfatase activity